jgi:uncharacterized protein YkwD
MRSPRRTLLPAFLLLVVLLCVQMVAPAQAITRAQAMREKLLYFVNEERRVRGVAPLREVSGLSDLARAHTLEMERQRRLFHTSRLGAKLSSWSPTYWGENVGMSTSIRSIVRMWEQSSAHRYNMVSSRFHRVGASVVFDGRYYWATLIVIT